MTSKILIVEDEAKLASLLADYLGQQGFLIRVVSDGAKVVGEFQAFNPDLVLLDIMLPNRDGLSICTDLRRTSNTPIIMTTARVEEIDRLLGLELGADDYICKPYSPREVVARVKAVLRRTLTPKDQDNQGFELDAERQKLCFHGKELDLTTVEFHLMQKLSKSAGIIFSRDQLMDDMYQDHRVVNDRTVDSHIKKLRKKLADKFPGTQFIHSVYGAGYRFEIHG